MNSQPTVCSYKKGSLWKASVFMQITLYIHSNHALWEYKAPAENNRDEEIKGSEGVLF